MRRPARHTPHVRCLPLPALLDLVRRELERSAALLAEAEAERNAVLLAAQLEAAA